MLAQLTGKGASRRAWRRGSGSWQLGEGPAVPIALGSMAISARRCRRCANGRGPPGSGVWERSGAPVFLLGAQHRCASARSRMSNAAWADVTKALEKFRAAVGRVQAQRYAFEGLSCERWGSANRHGGGREDRAAAVVRVVERRKYRPALARRSAQYPTDCRVRGISSRGHAARRSPRRFVPRATVAAAHPSSRPMALSERPASRTRSTPSASNSAASVVKCRRGAEWRRGG